MPYGARATGDDHEKGLRLAKLGCVCHLKLVLGRMQVKTIL